MKQLVLQVDTCDRPLELIEKMDAHKRGLLHRAFSICIFRRQNGVLQLLMHQRATNKYHSGGLWTNTCCSHAHPEVPLAERACQRLEEEMGFRCDLSYLGKTSYDVPVGAGMREAEISHVFVGFCDSPSLSPNPEEVAAYRWVEVESLREMLSATPLMFTAWFPYIFELVTLHAEEIF